MKKYASAVFLIVLTAAAAAAWFYGSPMKRRYSSRGIQVSLPADLAARTEKIEIRWRDVHTTLVRKNGRWFLAERGGRPAASARISALLSSLGTLQPVKEVRNVSRETLRELRLIENDPKLVPGVRVTLFDAGGRQLFSLLLGKGHFVRPEPGMPPSQDAEGRYVLIDGKVYLIPVVFENCHPVPSVWVEPLRLHELRKALRMNVLQFENGRGRPVWSVYRKSTAHPFTLSGPAETLAENRQLSALADRLSKPFTMDYFQPGKDWKAPRSLRLGIAGADGFTYVLDIFEGPAEYDTASLRVAYDPKKVLRYAGETDAQFRKRCAGLQRRFTEEKSISDGLMFRVPKDLSPLVNTVPKRK